MQTPMQSTNSLQPPSPSNGRILGDNWSSDTEQKKVSIKEVVRDKEGNPIPPGNQPQSPLGKGINGGPEKLPDPGSLGDPGNIPPDMKGPKGKIAAVLAASALLYDNTKDFFENVFKSKNGNKQQQNTVDAVLGADPGNKAKVKDVIPRIQNGDK